MKCDICGNELEDGVICPKCGNIINRFNDDYIEDDADWDTLDNKYEEINIDYVDLKRNKKDCEYDLKKLSVAQRILLIPTDEESTKIQQKEQYKNRIRVLMSMVIIIMLSFVSMIIVFKNNKDIHDNIYYITNNGFMFDIQGTVIARADDYMVQYNDRNSSLASFVQTEDLVETIQILNTKTNTLYYDNNSDFDICKGYDIAYRYSYIDERLEFYNLNNLKTPYATINSPNGYEISDFVISANGEKIAVFFESKDILYRAENEYRNYYTIIDKTNSIESGEYYNCALGNKMITNSGTVINIKRDNILEICNSEKSLELGEVKNVIFDSKNENVYILNEVGLYKISCHNQKIGKKELISENVDNLYAITNDYYDLGNVTEEYCYTKINDIATLKESEEYIFFMEKNILYQYELKTEKKKALMELDSKAIKVYYLENEVSIVVTNSYIYDATLGKVISKYYNTVAVCPVQIDNNCSIYFINGKNTLIKYDTYKKRENEIYQNVQIFCVYENGIIFYSGTNDGYYYHDGNEAMYIADDLDCNWYSGTYNKKNDANKSNASMPIITTDYIYYLTENNKLVRFNKNTGARAILKENVSDLYYLPYYK